MKCSVNIRQTYGWNDGRLQRTICECVAYEQLLLLSFVASLVNCRCCCRWCDCCNLCCCNVDAIKIIIINNNNIKYHHQCRRHSHHYDHHEIELLSMLHEESSTWLKSSVWMRALVNSFWGFRFFFCICIDAWRVTTECLVPIISGLQSKWCHYDEDLFFFPPHFIHISKIFMYVFIYYFMAI